MTSNKLLEKEILKLNTLIQSYEDTDPKYKTPEIKDLANKVSYVHSVIESSLELLFTIDVSGVMLSKPTTILRSAIYSKLKPFFDNIDFAKKINIAHKLKLIDSDAVEKFFAVNNIRKVFAHPTAYDQDIKKYQEIQEYLGVLKVLVNGLEKIDKIFGGLFLSRWVRPSGLK